MLSKKNKTLYKKLDGEYKEFAKEFTGCVYSRCVKDEKTEESIADVLSLLNEAQDGGRAFADVMPNPYAAIHDTIALLRPKRFRYIGLYIGILTAVFAAALLLVMYFSMWSPVVMANPQLSFDDQTNTVSWDAVEYAAGYRVYVDGEKAADVKGTAYNLGRRDEGSYEVYVLPQSNGRYKTDTEHLKKLSAKIKYPVTEVSIYEFEAVVIHAGDGFETFIEKSFVDMGYSGRAVIHFSPEFNVYGRIKTNARLIAVSCDGVEKPVSEEMWFLAGQSYSLVLDKEAQPALNYVYFFLYIRILGEGMEIDLPSGKTIFGMSVETNGYKCSAINVGEGFNICTTADLKIFSQAYGSAYRFARGREFYVVENMSRGEKRLVVGRSAETITQTSGTLSLKAGYTTLIIDESMDGADEDYWNGDESFLAVYSIPYGAAAFTGGESSLLTWFVTSGIYTGRCNSKVYHTVFLAESKTLEYECIDPNNIIELSEGDFTVGFGLFRVRNDTSAYKVLSGSDYILEYDMEHGKTRHDYQYVVGTMFSRKYFYNPHKKDITVTVV